MLRGLAAQSVDDDLRHMSAVLLQQLVDCDVVLTNVLKSVVELELHALMYVSISSGGGSSLHGAIWHSADNQLMPSVHRVYSNQLRRVCKCKPE